MNISYHHMTISEGNYVDLCARYNIFVKVGMEHFEPKIWLIFNALKDGQISQSTVSSNPCPSLMEHRITFEQIGKFLQELYNSGIFSRDYAGMYHVKSEIAYKLHGICYEITKNIDKSNITLKNILIGCGYPVTSENQEHVMNFESGSDGQKTEIVKSIFSKIAYSGTDFLLKIILGN